MLSSPAKSWLTSRADAIAVASPDRAGPRVWRKKALKLPELLLLPIVERMVVALRALHLQAEEDLGRLGRGLGGVLLELVHQEVDGAVEVLLARRVVPVAVTSSNDHLVVRLVAGERVAAGTSASPRG